MDANVKLRKDAPGRLGLARGFALFLGCFSLLNLIGEARSRHFDANLWWISFRPLPDSFGRALLLVGSVVLIAFAVQPNPNANRRRITFGAVVALLLTTLVNAVAFYVLLFRGTFISRLPIPLSLLFAAGLGWVLVEIYLGDRQSSPSLRQGHTWMAVGFLACLVGFPILQMFFFGATDYRRPADAMVVFGARVYSDGRLSSAVADRVAIASELYHQGLAPKVILSGGPGDGAIHETQAMRSMAITLGVRDEDILFDDGGVNTQSTVRDTCSLFRESGIHRVMAVSHFYHLPRVKLAYQRSGWDVYTVPVREPLRGTPWFMAREVAALWVYYLNPLV